MGNLRQEAEVFIHTRLLRVNKTGQDNVEAEEKSAMCHASLAGKDVGVFLFYFFAFKSFSGSRFNFRYVAKLFYLKIGKSSNSA